MVIIGLDPFAQLIRFESGVAYEQPPDLVGPPPPPSPKPVRYYGRAKIDPQRVARETSVIIEEVIQRLTSQVGAEVEVSLEIKATKRDGFDDQTVRTVSENSRTLRFEAFDFEEE